MDLRDIVKFVKGTADPAYAVDGLGNIVAWNDAATEAFGASSAEALSRPCHEVVRGTDEDGMICAADCAVKQSARNGTPVRNYDLRIKTPQGGKWFNISVSIVEVAKSKVPCIIHIARLVDVSKRLEMAIRDFVVTRTDVSEETAVALISSSHSAVRETYLTQRELEILSLIASGHTSAEVAVELNISSTTVDNHLQHILKKLNAHSRLEAVMRAEHSGLI